MERRRDAGVGAPLGPRKWKPLFPSRLRPAAVTLGQRLRQILPSHQDETLVFQELLELGALDHVEVVLAPGGAPVGVVEGRAAHLVVVVGQVDDDLVDTRAERRELLLVPRSPVFGGDAGRYLNGAVDETRFRDMLANAGIACSVPVRAARMGNWNSAPIF